MSEPKIFWIDNFKGVAQGGYFIRNDLFQFIDKVEKSTGKKVVGLIIEDGWNLEVIIEK